MRFLLFMMVVSGLTMIRPYTALGQLTPEQHQKLVQTARWLAQEGVGYAEAWNLPGESKPWVMDCSNTSRYFYKHLFGINLPRTASDQYYTLRQQGRVTDAPRLPNGAVDTEALLGGLRSGDLLFWEWTYDIKRTPPVSHVMIYLGRTADGTPKMAGSSSSSRGETAMRGGVDVYNFDPNANMGGVKDFFGNYKHRARFVGFGRVIEPASGGAQFAHQSPGVTPEG